MYEELKKRVERERAYHNQEKDVSKKAFNFKKLFRNYFSNPSLIEMENDLNKVKNISNKKVLDFGCGYGKDFDDLFSTKFTLSVASRLTLFFVSCGLSVLSKITVFLDTFSIM